MKLVKTNENVTRTFDAEGNAEERIDNASFDIRDNNGNAIGNANIGIGYASANCSLSGFISIEDGEAKLKEIFGISE